MDKLLWRRADVNKETKNGETALLAAVVGGNERIAQRLIEKWVDTNKATNDGFSPLYIATLKGNLKTVEQLLGKLNKIECYIKIRIKLVDLRCE